MPASSPFGTANSHLHGSVENQQGPNEEDKGEPESQAFANQATESAAATDEESNLVKDLRRQLKESREREKDSREREIKLIRQLIFEIVASCSHLGSQASSGQGTDTMRHLEVKEHPDCSGFIADVMPSMQLAGEVFDALRFHFPTWKKYADKLYGHAKGNYKKGRNVNDLRYPLEASYHAHLKKMFALLNRTSKLFRGDESGPFRPDYMIARPEIGAVSPRVAKKEFENIESHKFEEKLALPPPPSPKNCVNSDQVFKWLLDDHVEDDDLPKGFKCEEKKLEESTAYPALIYSVIEIKRLDVDAIDQPIILPSPLHRNCLHKHIKDGWFQVIGRSFTRCLNQQATFKPNELTPQGLPFIGALTDGSNFVCMKVDVTEEFANFSKKIAGDPPRKKIKVTHRLCKLNTKEAALYVALLSNFGCGNEFLFRAQGESRIDFDRHDPEPIFCTNIGDQKFQVFQELHVGEQLVHLAKDPNENQIVLKSSLINSNGIAREKWMLEFLASKHVEGIPTVKFYGPGSQSQNTMALSPVGRDMDFFVGRQLQLDLCHISQSLKKTLSQIHEQGIVHSDVKPRNVLLTQQNEVILIDFNLAVKKGECRAGYTAMFGSVNACLEGKPDFQDDWESLFYTLAYADKGGDLPWMLDYGKVHENSLEMKRTLLRELSVSLPTWIVPLKEHLDSVLEQLPNPNQDAQQTVMNVMQNVIAYSEATRNESQFFDE
jgi:hypothetical protein